MPAELWERSPQLWRTSLERHVFRTPYELFIGKPPKLGHFNALWSPAYALIKGPKPGKLGQRAWKGHLVGYDPVSKLYRIYNEETKRVELCHDVVFNEAPAH